MQQSVHRIEELVKIFIHATKVSAETRRGQRMSPGPLGLTRSTDTTHVDGNRVLGNICLGLREAGEVGSGSLVEGEQHMLLQRQERGRNRRGHPVVGRKMGCVWSREHAKVRCCRLPSPVSFMPCGNSRFSGCSGRVAPAWEHPVRTTVMPEYPGTNILSRLSAPLTARRPAAGCQVTPARKYFLGPKRCR